MTAKERGAALPKKENRPHGEITTINTGSIIAQTTAPVNPLRKIREDTGAAPAKIIEIVRRRHPKYDKTLQSKCEHTELYGVELAKDSFDDVKRELTPEEAKREAWIRQGRHKLNDKVSCRLSEEDSERFREIVRQSGDGTVQTYLAGMIRERITECETRDPKRSPGLQEKYCERNDYPYFAPSDGRCYRCHMNIYADLERLDGGISTGISVWKAGHRLVTGCPHCHYSFVE